MATCKTAKRTNAKRGGRGGAGAIKVVAVNESIFNRHIRKRLRPEVPQTWAAYRKQYGPLWVAMRGGELLKAGDKNEMLRFAKPNPARRSNPLEKAEEAYEGFHGRPSEKRLKIITPIHSHSVLWGLGECVELVVLTPDGKFRVKIKGFEDANGGLAYLSANEKRNQLFLEGGDQTVDLADFGIDPDSAHESEVLGTLHRALYYTVKDHLQPEDGGEAIYDHKFGGRREVENRGRRGKRGKRKVLVFTGKGQRIRVNGAARSVKSHPPTVLYDTVNRLISFAGGGYTIPDEGIDG